jgi:selenocysteine lyase/cysteine desulfurase
MRTKSSFESLSDDGQKSEMTTPSLPQTPFNSPPSHICYFNNAGKTPLPPSVQAAGQSSISIEANPWRLPLKETVPDQIRQEFASLIRAYEKEVAICPSTGFALTMVANNLARSWRRRVEEGGQEQAIEEKQIVILQDEMSSGVYPWQPILESTHATLKIAPHPSDTDGSPKNWTDSILSEMSSCTNLKVVCVPQVHWSDGSLIDVLRVSQTCRDRNAILVIDATQSVGILELNVSSFACPVILAASVHKWLLGPHGTTLLYVPSRLLEDDLYDWQPLDQHERSRIVFQSSVYDATEDNIDEHGYPAEFVDGAARLDSGGKKNPILLPMVLEGLKIVNSLNLKEAQEHLLTLTEYCIQRASEMKLEFGIQAGPRAGHILGLRPFGTTLTWLTPERMVGVVKRLIERGIYIAARAGAFRISPYLNTTYEEVDWLLEGLAQVLEEECQEKDHTNNATPEI